MFIVGIPDVMEAGRDFIASMGRAIFWMGEWQERTLSPSHFEYPGAAEIRS